MKFLETSKDGGPKSRVWAHWLVELKNLFSVVLLRFEDGSREAYHSHAFNAVSWVLKGRLVEDRLLADRLRFFRPSVVPIITTRDNIHKVTSEGRTWVLSFRGPWADSWVELAEDGQLHTLTHGRKER